MSYSAFRSGVGTKLEFDVQVSPPRRKSKAVRAQRLELEAKLVALQRDYAELHVALI